MDPELARLSRSVDPTAMGQRIKGARLALGLTQEVVAEGLVSAAYISRIEIGNRRPDTKLLEHLAKKLGTSVEALVLGVTRDELAETELALDYAELALKTGDADAGLADIDNVLKDRPATAVPSVVARARSLRATALEAVGDFNAAISELESLTRDSPKDAQWLKGLTALSRCHRESGDLARAVEVGEAAVAEIEGQGLTGTDEAIQLALTVAAAYFERGDVNQAYRLCQQTVDQAEHLGTTQARASAYCNASVMQSRQGSVASAVMLAKKALDIVGHAADARARARLKGSLAIIQLRLDPPDIAGAEANAADALREMEWSDASLVDKARARLTLAKAAYLAGRSDDALDIARQCLDAVENRAPLLAAEACVVLGRVSLSKRRAVQARTSFEKAVHLLTAIGADRKAAQMWFELGGLLQQAGNESGAMDAYRRAAASTGLTASEPVPMPVR